MKQVDVRFGSGQEVLTAYWGFLSDGGLIIPDRDDLDEGQPVQLNIHIDSTDKAYELGGKIVRRAFRNEHAIVAFHPGEPHDMLLTAALSETDDVPARQYHRFNLSLPVEVTTPDLSLAGSLVNISSGGCCVRFDGVSNGGCSVGASVTVATDAFSATGVVVWVRGADRGISFDDRGVNAAAGYISSL